MTPVTFGLILSVCFERQRLDFLTKGSFTVPIRDMSGLSWVALLQTELSAGSITLSPPFLLLWSTVILVVLLTIVSFGQRRSAGLISLPSLFSSSTFSSVFFGASVVFRRPFMTLSSDLGVEKYDMKETFL